MIKKSIFRLICISGVWFCPQFLISADLDSKDPLDRREAVLEIGRARPVDGIKLLSRALEDENMIVRRTAAHCLENYGKEAVAPLTRALSNSDEMVRIIALTELNEIGVLNTKLLSAALKDSSAAMRQRATDYLINIRPRTPETEALIKQASRDESPAVRNTAARALWSFHRNVVLLRDREDHVVKVTDRIKLPSEGWKLKSDPELVGHIEKWFDPELNDADWAKVGIEKYWGDFDSNYTGVAWYRGRIKLPMKPDYDAVELAFEGVDESAWIWVNGQYAGEHDLGLTGYDQPFQLDVGEFLKWGEENQITARIFNQVGAGGIYRPVTLQILKVGQ